MLAAARGGVAKQACELRAADDVPLARGKLEKGFGGWPFKWRGGCQSTSTGPEADLDPLRRSPNRRFLMDTMENTAHLQRIPECRIDSGT